MPSLLRNKASRRHLALILLALLPATPLLADSAYFEDFSSGSASADWSGTSLTVSQATGDNTSWFLGPLNNDTVTLSLNNLNGINFDPLVTPNSQGQHTFTTVSFDLFIIGDWQGNNTAGNPNAFTFNASSSDGGSTSLYTTFSNAPGAYQTFPYDASYGFYSQPGGKSANQINTLGFTGNEPDYNDTVYSMSGGRNQSFTFDQSADDLTLTFSAANLPADATWGITNVSVVTGGIFTWQAAPSVGDGLDGGWDVSQHWLNPDGSTDNIPGANDAAVFNDTSGSYNVSIHQDYSVGFFRVTSTESSTSGVQFNTIGHTLTITAGDISNTSIAVANGDNLTASLIIFNSDNDSDSNFNGVVNAETLGIGLGFNAQGTLTLDGYLDPNNPTYGNVILNVQREITIGNGSYGGPVSATLNILHGAILNSGLGGGSASSNPNDGNAVGVYAYVDGTVNVDDQAVWNQTGSIWIGVFAPGALNVTNGSQVNIFQPPYAGQAPATTGTLSIGGFAGSSGTVTVSDPDSVLNAGFIQVGTTGVDATLNIDNFATVNGTYVSIGSYINGFSGPSGNDLVNVTHQGQLNATTTDGSGMLNVGDYFDGNLDLGFVSGTDGSLFNVGLATADSVIIGNAAGVYGEVDVNYAQAANLHSLLTVNKTLIVGESGHGVLAMDGGGVTVVLGQGAAPSTIVTAGDQPGSYGLITMGGGSGIAGPGGFSQGSTLDASAGGIVLGNSGFGRLEMIIGGEAFAQTVIMAQNPGSSAEMLIQGDTVDSNHQTFLKVSDFITGLTIGQAGNTASIDIQQGGLLDTYRATVGGQGNDLAAGSVSLEDSGSLWLVHAQNLGTFFGGGTLDVGGEGLGGQHGGTGLVTLNAGTQVGVEVALQIAKNGKVVLNGGAMTVGSVDPAIMSTTPDQLHIVGNTTLNLAQSKVYGQGEIDADVLLDNGGDIGPNGFIGGTTGTLTIVGSLHELLGGDLLFKLEGAAAGMYDTVALDDPLLTGPAGDALLENGAGVTLIGEAYTAPQIGDFFDVLTAGTVEVGTLDVTFVNLPSTGWYYGEVSLPGGGEALRFEYGEPVSVPEPASLTLLALGAAALGLRRKR